MLDLKELKNFYLKLGISHQAQKVIETIRSSEPLRKVKGNARNISGNYPSLKMGRTIQFESHQVELIAIKLFYEYDDDVYEYWDQAFQFPIKYKANSGKNITTAHIPDFFVIRKNSVGFEEWKPEITLENLAIKQSNRYSRTDDDLWHSPPAEEYAQKLGVYYRLRSNIEIDWIKYRNIQYLRGYLDKQYIVSDEIANIIIAVVTLNPGITFDQLREEAKVASVDDINALIATNNIYIDLSATPLIEQERVHIFRDKVTAEAYAIAVHSRSNTVTHSLQVIDVQVGLSIIWDSKVFTIKTMGETKIWLSGDDVLVSLAHAEFHKLVEHGEIKGIASQLQEQPSINSTGWEYFLQASPETLSKANKRYQSIVSYLRGDTIEVSSISERTIRDWKAKFKKAKEKYGCGLIGLIDQKKGNSISRYSSDTWEFIDKIIKEEYETFKQKNVWATYEHLKDQWEEEGILEPIPSHTTFYERVKQHSGYKQTKNREGSRAANQKLPPFKLEFSTPRHGDRPFEIVHIDHTLLDIEIVCGYTDMKLGRPWVTAMIDAYTRRILAVYITFDAPSYRSCMMVMRICVQRFGRFPETIVVDNGKEFKSIYFDTLLARFECCKKHRPPDMPKFSSIIERWFGTNNTQFINNLRGNTQITKHIRLVKKANNPKNLAVWTLDEFYEYFANGYCYSVYEQKKHPALEGFSPFEAFAAGLAHSGSRPHQKIIYDEQFRILTLPSVPKGTAKVQPATGVRINYQDYWSIDDSFLRPDIEGKQVPVRYDPFDYATAYAYVQGHWVRCISKHYNRFQGHSEREVMIATMISTRKRQIHGKKIGSKVEEIAHLLKDAEAHEELLLQRQRDLAAKGVRDLIENKPAYTTSLSKSDELKDRNDLPDNNFTGTNSVDIKNNNLPYIKPYDDRELWQ
ncbi:MAG: DDE-type integrase/transposase/recombinase [Nostoc sp.]|uniref:DDE-type integrase/transposase/recombinase n=1 Tax=Nostoc sp. TaxID=1180 RepID=UPI002FFCCA35